MAVLERTVIPHGFARAAEQSDILQRLVTSDQEHLKDRKTPILTYNVRRLSDTQGSLLMQKIYSRQLPSSRSDSRRIHNLKLEQVSRLS
jgi:hypothetical protein